MNIDFTGKTAIVTGAAHGFGRAIAQAFAERGAQVWACDVLDDELGETAALCRSAGGSCHAVIADVRDRAAVDACVAAAAAASGRVDILVNNAGGVLGQVGRPLEEITPERLAGDLRRQRHRRLLLLAGRGARHEGARAADASSTSRAAPGSASASPASRPMRRPRRRRSA